ncbi:MAG TPA: hypothetical protein VNT01_05450 [Symbiobacteriaceae bacterium]|nr:hypothetical protein [Symbiobacteriaceae bacterium]
MKNLVFVMLIALMTTLGLTWTANPNPKHQPGLTSTMACGGVEGMGDFCDQ